MWKKKKKKQETEQILKQSELELCGPGQKTLEKFTTSHAALEEEEKRRVEKAIEKLEQGD